MIVVDTSVWIEFLRGHHPYADTLQAMLERGDVLTCEAIFGELLQGARDERERELLDTYWRSLPRAEILHPLVRAGHYASIHGLTGQGIGLIDACIIVAAKSMQATMWTLDRKLAAYLERIEPSLLEEV